MFRNIFFSQERALKKTAWDQVSKAYFVVLGTWVLWYMNFCMQKSYICLGIPIYLEEKYGLFFAMFMTWSVLLPYYVW